VTILGEFFLGMVRTGILALALTVVITSAGAFAQQDGKQWSQLKQNELLAVGAEAPDWTLNDPSGKPHKLSDFRGSVVVLDFWATWCGPCAQLMPKMQKLQDKYAERGVRVFGVNAWERADPVSFVTQKRLTYTNLLNGEQIAASYGVINLPVVYIVGVDGKIIHRHEGLEDKNLGKIIEKHLKENGK
jgi:thiol-disulfide isomerase/thioredoxin